MVLITLAIFSSMKFAIFTSDFSISSFKNKPWCLDSATASIAYYFNFFIFSYNRWMRSFTVNLRCISATSSFTIYFTITARSSFKGNGMLFQPVYSKSFVRECCWTCCSTSVRVSRALPLWLVMSSRSSFNSTAWLLGLGRSFIFKYEGAPIIVFWSFVVSSMLIWKVRGGFYWVKTEFRLASWSPSVTWDSAEIPYKLLKGTFMDSLERNFRCVSSLFDIQFHY